MFAFQINICLLFPVVGNPDHGNDECGYLYDDTEWADTNCDSSEHYICEGIWLVSGKKSVKTFFIVTTKEYLAGTKIDQLISNVINVL